MQVQTKYNSGVWSEMRPVRSLLVMAFSQSSGAFLPSNSLKKANWAQATCFTCSPKLRTSSNFPVVGTKEYLFSGMASATPRKFPSANWSVPLMLSAIDLGMSSCWAAGLEVDCCSVLDFPTAVSATAHKMSRVAIHRIFIPSSLEPLGTDQSLTFRLLRSNQTQSLR